MPYVQGICQLGQPQNVVAIALPRARPHPLHELVQALLQGRDARVHPVLPREVVLERRAQLLLVDLERSEGGTLADGLEREVDLVEHVLRPQAVFAEDDQEVGAALDRPHDGGGVVAHDDVARGVPHGDARRLELCAEIVRDVLVS